MCARFSLRRRMREKRVEVGWQEENTKGNKRRAGIPMQQRAGKMSLYFVAERRDLRRTVAGNTRVPPRALWQGRKTTCSLLFPRDPSTIAAQTRWATGESTSIRPVPRRAPLKDKTTTISLCFPASHCLFGHGYVHHFFPPLQPCCHSCAHVLSVHRRYVRVGTTRERVDRYTRGGLWKDIEWDILNMAVDFARMTAQSNQPLQSQPQAVNAGRPPCQPVRQRKGAGNLGSDFPFGRSSITVFPFHFIWFHMFHRAIYFILRVGVTSIFIFKPLGPGADTGWPLF